MKIFNSDRSTRGTEREAANGDIEKKRQLARKYRREGRVEDAQLVEQEIEVLDILASNQRLLASPEFYDQVFMEQYRRIPRPDRRQTNLPGSVRVWIDMRNGKIVDMQGDALRTTPMAAIDDNIARIYIEVDRKKKQITGLLDSSRNFVNNNLSEQAQSNLLDAVRSTKELIPHYRGHLRKKVAGYEKMVMKKEDIKKEVNQRYGDYSGAPLVLQHTYNTGIKIRIKGREEPIKARVLGFERSMWGVGPVKRIKVRYAGERQGYHTDTSGYTRGTRAEDDFYYTKWINVDDITYFKYIFVHE